MRLRSELLEEKKSRVRRWMAAHGFDYVILARRDSFAWFTSGGNNRVFFSSDNGAGILVIGRRRVFLVAESMDCSRIMDEELDGTGIVPIMIHWYDGGCTVAALKLTSGRVASDIPMTGSEYVFKELLRLHLPLLPIENQRLEMAGREADQAMSSAADKIVPGMTEIEIQGLILGEYGKLGMIPKVVLIGTDERIARYRHPVATGKKLEKTVLLHVAAEHYGLHANITRMICFGAIPGQLSADYDFLNRLQAMIAASLCPGTFFGKILETRRKMMEQYGVLNEYDNHYPGSTTGYFIGNADPLINNELVAATQCFDWFLTLTGCKVEELIQAGQDGGRILSVLGNWPTREYTWQDYKCKLPMILQKG